MKESWEIIRIEKWSAKISIVKMKQPDGIKI
jgi:hypothetical protein